MTNIKHKLYILYGITLARWLPKLFRVPTYPFGRYGRYRWPPGVGAFGKDFIRSEIMIKQKEVRSHLSYLREAYPDFNWPEQGKQGDYPEEIGAQIGETRRFGFLLHKYELIFRTSREQSAIERLEELIITGKQALITYNPIRLETYGIWLRIC